jgi:hypothetical protein
MKKILYLILSVCMLFVFVACNDGSQKEDNGNMITPPSVEENGGNNDNNTENGNGEYPPVIDLPPIDIGG